MESYLATVLEIPHLIEAICKGLSLDNIKQCRLVNHFWSAAFVPFLWQTLYIRTPNPPNVDWQRYHQMEKTLACNAYWIRSLHLDCTNSLFQIVLSCTRLRSLSCAIVRRDLYRMCKDVVDCSSILLLLISQNEQLRHLELSRIDYPSGHLTEDLLLAVTTHPTLQSLKLDSLGEIDPNSMVRLLGSCPPTLQSLEIDFAYSGREMYEGNGDERPLPVLEVDEDAVQGWPIYPNLTRVHFLGSLERNESTILVPFLKSCPNLTDFGMPDIRPFTIPDLLVDLFRMEECKIDSLSLFSYDLLDAYVVEVLVKAFRRPLRSLIMDGFLDEWSLPCTPAIVAHAGANLEVFKVGGNIEITSKHIQLVLTSCPRLKEFSHFCLEDRQGSGMSVQDFIEKEWVCMELEVLELTLNDGPIILVPEEGEERVRAEDVKTACFEKDIQRKFVRVYRQIGALTHLYELRLGWVEDYDDLRGVSLKPGIQVSLEAGLGALRGLKKLRTFDVVRVKGLVLEKETRAWMDKHWPWLENLVVPEY